MMTKRMSKKLFGMGVGAAFIGGAGFGFGAGLASYSIYHRYHHYRQMLHNNGHLDDWDENYYSSNYEKNECMYGCPPRSHCEWGFCECDAGKTKLWGQCSKFSENQRKLEKYSSTSTRIPHLSCTSSAECQKSDINMVCLQNRCVCRKDMQWNNKAFECQILLDVDCTSTNYYSNVSPLVKEALEKIKSEEKNITKENLFTKEEEDLLKLAGPAEDSLRRSMLVSNMMTDLRSDNPKITQSGFKVPGGEIPNDRTETQEESLKGSLLKYIDPNRASKSDLVEAFCRDIDAFN